MKRLISILLLVLCVAILAGCQCEHTWVEASCEVPKTCSQCQKTDGAPLGHTWRAATCKAPKTCEICGLEQGEAAGHTWVEATCTAPKHCLDCELTEGVALEHEWQRATTEKPKTCAVCGSIEGDRIVTDSRFTTAANQAVFGFWETEMTMTGEELEMADYVTEVPFIATLHFGEAGDLALSMRFKDLDAFLTELNANTVELIYQQFADLDMDQEAADEAFESTYGMTVAEYAESIWAVVNWDNLFDVYATNYVYYIDGDQIYLADSWDDEFVFSAFTLDGDKMTIVDSEISGGTVLELTRVPQGEE
jgi:hypothetical protein